MVNSTGRGAVFSAVKRMLADIDRRWPAVKFCSLGFYNAWILLMFSGVAAMASTGEFTTGGMNSLLYLYSGIPLTIVLLVCGALGSRAEHTIAHGPLVPCAAVVAAVCTFIVSGPHSAAFGHAGFMLAAMGTGATTALLCLRIGHMFSYLGTDRLIFATLGVGLFSNLLFFMVISLNGIAASLTLASFPLCAALLAQLKQGIELDAEFDFTPASMLPKGFLLRCVIVVGVFAVAVGVMKGGVVLSVSTDSVKSQAVMSVFCTVLVQCAIVCTVAFISGIRKFNSSKLYYPIVFFMALVCVATPLFGGSHIVEQSIASTAAYNVFMMVVWCIFANIAGQTDMSPTRVFGFGRGASAFGTTLGQFIAFRVISSTGGFDDFFPKASFVFAVVLLVAALLVFDERTIGDALEKTFHRSAKVTGRRGAALAERSWDEKCGLVAERFRLTAREQESLKLVGHGRTAKFIAEELGISYSTAKGHIKNLYAKCGVHSRDELINLIDKVSSQG